MKNKKGVLVVVYGKLSEPVDGCRYASAYLKEGSCDTIDPESFTTHSCKETMIQYADLRKLAHSERKIEMREVAILVISKGNFVLSQVNIPQA